MTSLCPHSSSESDCIQCELNFRREYLANLETLVLACKRQIREIERRQVKQVSGTIYYWPGLGEK